ncbi:hypothetical protein [Aneurinibacillus sp. REN35]|uniref:hypothetical protein n=1 Tax=Aneurinibacillus sp. REN35 TaxID=3237286 RepID=UPI003526CDA3
MLEFDLFRKNLKLRGYVKRGKKNKKYHILTAKQPLAGALQYEVIILKNHQEIARRVVKGKQSDYLLTPTKRESVKLLLKQYPDVYLNEIVMLHYKQDRPNGSLWDNDAKCLEELYYEYKR